MHLSVYLLIQTKHAHNTNHNVTHNLHSEYLSGLLKVSCQCYFSLALYTFLAVFMLAYFLLL